MLGIPARWPNLPEWLLDLMLAGAALGVAVYVIALVTGWWRSRKKQQPSSDDVEPAKPSPSAPAVEPAPAHPTFPHAITVKSVLVQMHELESQGCVYISFTILNNVDCAVTINEIRGNVLLKVEGKPPAKLFLPRFVELRRSKIPAYGEAEFITEHDATGKVKEFLLGWPAEMRVSLEFKELDMTAELNDGSGRTGRVRLWDGVVLHRRGDKIATGEVRFL